MGPPLRSYPPPPFHLTTQDPSSDLHPFIWAVHCTCMCTLAWCTAPCACEHCSQGPVISQCSDLYCTHTCPANNKTTVDGCWCVHKKQIKYPLSYRDAGGPTVVGASPPPRRCRPRYTTHQLRFWWKLSRNFMTTSPLK